MLRQQCFVSCFSSNKCKTAARLFSDIHLLMSGNERLEYRRNVKHEISSTKVKLFYAQTVSALDNIRLYQRYFFLILNEKVLCESTHLPK